MTSRREPGLQVPRELKRNKLKTPDTKDEQHNLGHLLLFFFLISVTLPENITRKFRVIISGTNFFSFDILL